MAQGACGVLMRGRQGRSHQKGTRDMPKVKTHRGAAKRFKLTGSGKLMRRQAFRSHLLEKKSSRRTRRLHGEVALSPADRREAMRLLGKA